MRLHSRLGFTILEVLLSVTIMTVIVYSLFIVFDNTLKVIDKIFVGAQKYESLRNFFENLRRELNSSVANKPGELYRFRGGPHWIEFATPVIKSADDINTYLKQGVNQLTAEYHKIHYFGARPSESATGEPSWIRYQLPIFRMEAKLDSPLGDPHHSFLVSLNGSEIEHPKYLKYSGKSYLPLVNKWLEKSEGRKTVHDWDTIVDNPLQGYYDIRKVLDTRYLKFRYFYTVHYIEEVGVGKTKTSLKEEYSQDWWDSAIRYPVIDPDEYINFEEFFKDPLYTNNSDLIAIEAERSNRYAADLSYGDNSLYEKEPYTFRAFAPKEDWTDKFKFDQYTAASYRSLVLGVELDDDPWLLAVPSSIEVSVTLFDLQEGSENITGGSYLGETFVMRIFLRANSKSVSGYQSNLLNE